jgi:Tfp pilus assembly protein PilV
MSYASQRAPRGISLIEALVAMAVMAFGMIGVVGMQATLRGNADLSKQRTEAMRIAQERMEELRNFSVLSTTAGAKAFADKATVGATAVAGYTTNTTYTVSATVTAAGAAPHQQKDLAVDVAWTDRAGTTQNVRLMSTMANIAPELGASMVVSAQGASGVREPEGRRRGIPPQAKNFGDGTSGFIPPQPTPTVAWVFNNVTGLIASVCTTSVADNASITSLADFTGCVTTQAYQLISGFIRFSTAGAPTTAGIADPTSAVDPLTIEAEVAQTLPATATIGCFHSTAVVASTYKEYFCAVPVTTPAPATWSGTLQIKATTLPNLAPNQHCPTWRRIWPTTPSATARSVATARSSTRCRIRSIRPSIPRLPTRTSS